MGVRELVWAAIALLGVYIVWQLYRAAALGRGGRRGGPGAGADKPAAADSAAAEEGGEADFEAYAPRPAGSGNPQAFELGLQVQQLRRELRRMGEELHTQRQQTAALAEGLRVLREAFDASQASAGASPEYDEALVFARRGFSAEAIAERCGISVAEAQLVLSLARGGREGQ